LTFFFHAGKELNKHGHIFGIDINFNCKRHWLGLGTWLEGIQQPKQQEYIGQCRITTCEKVEDNGLMLKFHVVHTLPLWGFIRCRQNDPESSESDLAQQKMCTTWSRKWILRQRGADEGQ
jgi:hypothetical protein